MAKIPKVKEKIVFKLPSGKKGRPLTHERSIWPIRKGTIKQLVGIEHASGMHVFAKFPISKEHAAIRLVGDPNPTPAALAVDTRIGAALGKSSLLYLGEVPLKLPYHHDRFSIAARELVKKSGFPSVKELPLKILRLEMAENNPQRICRDIHNTELDKRVRKLDAKHVK